MGRYMFAIATPDVEWQQEPRIVHLEAVQSCEVQGIWYLCWFLQQICLELARKSNFLRSQGANE